MEDFCKYINTKFNTNLSVSYVDNIYIPKTNYVKFITSKISILIILIIIFMIFKNELNYYVKWSGIIYIICYLICIIIYSLQYGYNFYKYKEIYKKHDYKFSELVFNTGDIIQEPRLWCENDITFIDPFLFFHSSIIINFNNKPYGIHFYPDDFFLYKKYIRMGHIFIVDFEDSVKYITEFKNYPFRLFRNKNGINNDQLLQEVINSHYDKISFNTMLIFGLKSINDAKNIKSYSCIGYIMYILSKLNIISRLNFRNFFPDDLVFIPYASNGAYEDAKLFIY
jgi:hypothetical protein